MTTSPGFVGRGLVRVVKLYQQTAPVRRARCRYIPTCSQYAVEAISLHGAGRGSWLALRRLSRCQPFGSFGFDPVPTDDHAHHNRHDDAASDHSPECDAAPASALPFTQPTGTEH